uniref:Pentatricopeptide repeat-containing protein n=1 Tax=Chenopodium quinoa TaxID=63459 RepID=A0A803M0I0_CHEQI
MFIAYSCDDKPVETLKLFSSFVRNSSVSVKPDNFTLTCVLKALSSLFSDGNLAREIHCYALRRGFELDFFVVNPLITYYARCDELGMARKVFDLMRKRDLVSWNSMISGYSQGGCFEECLNLYKLLLDEKNLSPDGVTVASVLQACAQKRDLVQGMEVHKFAVDKNIKIDTLVCNSIIGMYAKCGSLDYAKELFDKMSERDEVTYGCLISGYLAHGFVEKAMDLFRRMESPSLSTWNGVISGLAQNNFHEISIGLTREMQDLGFKPNSVTVASVLSALSHFCNPSAGKQVHAYAIRNYLEDNIYVVTGLIDVYGKAGFLQGAQHVFDQSWHRSVMVWTAIIAAHATNGDANHALNLFDDMLNQGTQPDPVTLTAILTACAYLGDIDKAWKILEDMHDNYGIQPLAEHYACIVGVLTQVGKKSEAEKFKSKMPIVLSAKAVRC